MAFLCDKPKCEREFTTLKELIEHKNDPKAFHGTQAQWEDIQKRENEKKRRLEQYRAKEVQTEKKEEKSQAEVPLPKPRLTYRYEGYCPECRESMHTIEVEAGEYNIVTAYCVKCQKQLAQDIVIPILKQNDYIKKRATKKIRSNAII